MGDVQKNLPGSARAAIIAISIPQDLELELPQVQAATKWVGRLLS